MFIENITMLLLFLNRKQSYFKARNHVPEDIASNLTIVFAI